MKKHRQSFWIFIATAAFSFGVLTAINGKPYYKQWMEKHHSCQKAER